MDIVDQLEDLVKQATSERSHYYVAGAAERAIDEIKYLRFATTQLQKALVAALELIPSKNTN